MAKLPSLEFGMTKDWEDFSRSSLWANFVMETATDKEGQVYMRNARKKNGPVYKSDGDGGYRCTSCGSEIQAAEVAHPIWDGPFPMSGSGRVHRETVPYCPKCEGEPNYHGEPISVPSDF